MMEVEWVMFDEESPPEERYYVLRQGLSGNITDGWLVTLEYIHWDDVGYSAEYWTPGVSSPGYLSHNDFWLRGLDVNAPCEEPIDMSQSLNLSVREMEV